MFVKQEAITFTDDQKAKFEVTDYEVGNAVLRKWNIYRKENVSGKPSFYWDREPAGKDEVVMTFGQLERLPKLGNGNTEVVVDL